MPVSRAEINRKLLHLGSGCGFPIAALYLPRLAGGSPGLPAIFFGILLVASLAMEWLRLHVGAANRVFGTLAGAFLREEEHKAMTGSTYLVAAAFVCTILFRDRPDITFVSLNLFILGDAVAAVAGQSIGRVKIGRKSLEGSLACFALCVLLGVFVYPHVPLLLDRWDGRLPLPTLLVVSLAVTLLELVPIRLSRTFVLNDNLAVPVLAGLILLWLSPA